MEVVTSTVELVIAENLLVDTSTVETAIAFGPKIEIRTSSVHTLYYLKFVEPDIDASSVELEPRTMSELIALAKKEAGLK